VPTVPVTVKVVACVVCHLVKVVHLQAHQMKCPYCKCFTEFVVLFDSVEVQFPVPQPEWPE